MPKRIAVQTVAVRADAEIVVIEMVAVLVERKVERKVAVVVAGPNETTGEGIAPLPRGNTSSQSPRRRSLIPRGLYPARSVRSVSSCSARSNA